MEDIPTLYALGWDVPALVERFGLSRAGVWDVLRRAGYYPPESPGARAAGIAASESARVRRERIASRALDLAEALQARVLAPTRYFKLDREVGAIEHEVPEPSAVDQLRLVTAVQRAVETAARLDLWSGADPGVVSLLTATAEALGLRDGE